ncbi:hypothetical protein [Cupriavidus sp. BIS7]|uniref:hypothetical protein n=1 Tax=Cupriavidus sp. BIS7 TaxID=1217718 RepID=UPI0006881412|nr:hypothetical protein [Cupriavidus sp. BIS7]
MTHTVFDSALSLGSRDDNAIAEYLMSIEDTEGAKRILAQSPGGQGLGFGGGAYRHSGLTLGFIGRPTSEDVKLEIRPASMVKADHELASQRIKISLDKFYVHEYPGMGEHTILCEFAGKNQVEGDVEELRFALRTKVRDKASASISGHPIFLGVTVGQNGVAFEGRTVNVASSLDDTVLAALDSAAFKSGLSLMATAQPALKPFAGLAASVVKSTMDRKKNAQVHTFHLGLDFGGNASSVQLREGSYVVVQSDNHSWDWSHYEWDRNTLSLQTKNGKQPNANYMVFGVSKFETPAPAKKSR